MRTPKQSAPPPEIPPELPPEPEPVTLGELMNLVMDEPVLPGFEVSDEPLPTPAAKTYSQMINEQAESGKTILDRGKPEEPQHVLRGDVLPPSKPGGDVRYESRIRVLDAWQYAGSVSTAPVYVNRNWIGYATEHDTVRKLEPGPCLRVPLDPDDPSVVVICRVGDYVVHEEIVGDEGDTSEKIEVWEREQFRRLFLPKPKQVTSSPAKKAGRA